MTVKIIDTHAHVVLSKAFGKAGKYGPEIGKDKNGLPFFRIGEYEMKPMQYKNTIFMENNLRIEAMDKLGIDLKISKQTLLQRCFFQDFLAHVLLWTANLRR